MYCIDLAELAVERSDLLPINWPIFREAYKAYNIYILKNLKQIFSILFFFLATVYANAQKVSQTDSLYLVALEKYAVEIDSFYTKYSSEPERYSTIFIEDNDLIRDFPDSISGYNVTVLTSDNWKKVYRENKKRLIHLKIFPIKIEDEFISVTLIPYHGELKRRKYLHLGLSDWTKVYFKQDCDSGKWSYVKTENGGI